MVRAPPALVPAAPINTSPLPVPDAWAVVVVAAAVVAAVVVAVAAAAVVAVAVVVVVVVVAVVAPPAFQDRLRAASACR